jgi:hypothetical protein
MSRGTPLLSVRSRWTSVADSPPARAVRVSCPLLSALFLLVGLVAPAVPVVPVPSRGLGGRRLSRRSSASNKRTAGAALHNLAPG